MHLAKRSQLAFDAASPVRAAFVAASEEALADLLRRAAESLDAGRPPSMRGCSFGEGPAAGPVALLFPGQGSQYVGMGGDLAAHFDDARAPWDEAAGLDVFDAEGLHDRVFPPPALDDAEREAQAQRLTATAFAQPALACASLAMLQLCRRVGIAPVAVGGHSLGEVTALAAGGAIGALDAVRLARTRGELMETASRAGEGAMTAVTADRARVEEILARSGVPVTIANHNAPRQVVLSGERAAIEAIEARLGEEGVKAQRLAVATAFHSPIVAAACAPLRRALDEVAFAPATVPVYSNVTAAPYPPSVGAMRDQLASAVEKPVRFVDQVEAMYASGARTFVEVGPGRVLTQLVGRCLEGRPHLAVALDRPGDHGATALFHALGQLAVAGVPLDLAPLWEGQRLPDDPAERPATKHTVRLNGANFGKPYPADAERARMARALPHALPFPRPFPCRLLLPQPPCPTRPHPRATPPTPPISSPPCGSCRRRSSPRRWNTSGRWRRATPRSSAPWRPRTRPSRARPSCRSRRSRRCRRSRRARRSRRRSRVPPPPAAPPDAAARRDARPPARRRGPRARSAAPPHPAPAAVAKVVLAAPADLLPLMLSAVSEKTGYPVEMIDPTMDLAADLGIDSIKRVEILSALRERAPGLPAIEPAQLGKLRTLAEIIHHLEAKSDAPPSTQPAPAPAAAAPRRAEVARFVVEARPSPLMGLAAPGLFGDGVLAVIPDDQGIAPLLCERLQGHGIRAQVTDVVPPDARGVLFLGGLSDAATLDDAIRIQRDAFEAARTFARRAREGGGLFVPRAGHGRRPRPLRIERGSRLARGARRARQDRRGGVARVLRPRRRRRARRQPRSLAEIAAALEERSCSRAGRIARSASPRTARVACPRRSSGRSSPAASLCSTPAMSSSSPAAPAGSPPPARSPSAAPSSRGSC